MVYLPAVSCGVLNMVVVQETDTFVFTNRAALLDALPMPVPLDSVLPAMPSDKGSVQVHFDLMLTDQLTWCVWRSGSWSRRGHGGRVHRLQAG